MFPSPRGARIPRAELWLGHRLFLDLGWKDDLEARGRICQEFGMDMVFLPVADVPPPQDHFDYQHFGVDDLDLAILREQNLPLGVILDGPFQRLSRELGLLTILKDWRTGVIAEWLHNQAVRVDQLVSACLDHDPDILVVADDIAYQRSTYVSSGDLEKFLFTLYMPWIKRAHSKGTRVLFHSDGNIADVASSLVTCGFNGFAACEFELTQMRTLLKRFSSKLLLLGGIPYHLVEEQDLGEHYRQQFVESVRELGNAGHLN